MTGHGPEPGPATNPGPNGYARVNDVVAIVQLATDPILAGIKDLRSDIGSWREADQAAVAKLREEFMTCRSASLAFRTAEAQEEARKQGQWAAVWAVVRFTRSEWRTLGLLLGWAATVALAVGVRP